MAQNQKYQEDRVLSLPTSNLKAGNKHHLYVGGGKYKDFIVSDALQLTEQAGSEYIECSTMAQMRALDSRQIWALQNGYYKGVKLSGYYVEGDTPATIEYYLSETGLSDDGGSVIYVGGIKLEHDFGDECDVRYYGASPSLADNADIVQKVWDKFTTIHHDLNATYKISKPLVLGQYKNLIGGGCKRTIFQKTTATTSGISGWNGGDLNPFDYDVDAVLIIGVNNSYCRYPNIKGIGFQHTSEIHSTYTLETSEKYYGIYAPFMAYAGFEDVESMFNGVGLYIKTAFLSTFDRLFTRNSYIGGVKVETGTSLTFNSSYVGNCKKFGWDVTSSYSSINNSAADFIGGYPVTPESEPCDYAYKLGNGVSLNNCGAEVLKGTLIYCTGTGPQPSIVNGFKVLNYSGTFDGAAIRSSSNGNLAIKGLILTFNVHPVTAKLYESSFSSYLWIQDSYSFPALTDALMTATNGSTIRVSDASGDRIFSSPGSFRSEFGYRSNRPMMLDASFDKGRLILAQNTGGFSRMNVWVKPTDPYLLMTKVGNQAEGYGAPSSGTDGIVLTSIVDRGTTAQRPTNAIIGYLYYDTDLQRTVQWNGSFWLDWNRNATPSAKGIVNQSAASADTAQQSVDIPTKAEFDALLAELRDLKTKMRTAGILAT